ncbi:MAG: hypothetical protein RL518_2213 [Pseudomonadota bacterium]
MRSGCLLQQFSLVLLTFLTVVAPQSARAATSPYRASLEVHGLRDVVVRASSAKAFDVIPSVKVSGRVANLGRIDARFNLRRNKTWTSVVDRRGTKYIDSTEPLLLRGKVAVGGGTIRKGRRVYATAASVINKELKITIPGRATGSRQSRQRIYTVRVLLNGSIKVSARVTSVPAHAFHRGACGAAVGSVSIAEAVHQHAEEHTEYTIMPIATEESPVGEPGEAKSTRVITISTDADPEWYAKYGESSNAVIASILNTAEAIYDSQLNIRFRLVKQHVYTQSSPYTMTDAATLLKVFTGNSENRANLSTADADFHDQVDLKHLFTGKDLDGSVIGIAYIGTVCAAPALAFGVTQSYVDAALPGIFAHELGHNFGGFHDVSDRGGLMYPSISIPSATRFSSVSVQEISNHLSRYSRCLSTEMMTPRQAPAPGPTAAPEPPVADPGKLPARISVRRELVRSGRERISRVSGRVLSDTGMPIGAVKLNLVVQEKTVAQVVTNDDGEYQVLVKFSVPSGRQVYTYMETTDGMVSSRFMWVGATRR